MQQLQNEYCTLVKINEMQLHATMQTSLKNKILGGKIAQITGTDDIFIKLFYKALYLL